MWYNNNRRKEYYMAKIRVAEEMTNEQLLKEFLRMRDELDTLSKKYDSLAKEHYDLKAK